MLIKIIAGNYGYSNGISVRVKTPSDAPFDVDNAEGERLISRGIAVAVKVSDKIDVPDSNNSDVNSSPSYDESMPKATLQSIAKEYGVEVSEKASKTEIVAALDDYFSDIPDFSEV